jgi:hypothetical protein
MVWQKMLRIIGLKEVVVAESKPDEWRKYEWLRFEINRASETKKGISERQTNSKNKNIMRPLQMNFKRVINLELTR